VLLVLVLLLVPPVLAVLPVRLLLLATSTRPSDRALA
jgi:hypothetical protein